MLEEVERQHGTREFVGVHARVEGDWEEQCRGAQNRTDPSTMLFGNEHGCWVRLPLLKVCLAWGVKVLHSAGIPLAFTSREQARFPLNEGRSTGCTAQAVMAPRVMHALPALLLRKLSYIMAAARHGVWRITPFNMTPSVMLQMSGHQQRTF